MTNTRVRRAGSPWRYVAAAAAIMALAAAILLAMGRTPFCRCGSIRLWTPDAWGPENSQQLTDPYTFTHITHGILLYFIAWIVAPGLSLPARAVLVIAAESAWEVLENTDMVIDRYRAATMALGYYGDSVFNSMGDILACAGGFAIASRLPARATIALVIVLELALTMTIRDSLLLNIVMLVHPIDAVRTWQAGH
jgi:hypothetical protein